MSPGGPFAGATLWWAGRMPFERAVAENTAMVARVLAGGQGGVMAFEPAAPVYTLGRRASGAARDRGPLLSSLGLCRERGIAVVAADRGGLGTLHLPGQLVLFVALRCRREQTPSVVQRLLGAVVGLGERRGLSCTLRAGPQAGVFGPSGGKLASVGMRHADGVLRHGVSINVSVDFELARDLSLCGRVDLGLANLGPAAPCPPALDRVAAELAVLLGLPTGSPTGPR